MTRQACSRCRVRLAAFTGEEQASHVEHYRGQHRDQACQGNIDMAYGMEPILWQAIYYVSGRTQFLRVSPEMLVYFLVRKECITMSVIYPKGFALAVAIPTQAQKSKRAYHPGEDLRPMDRVLDEAISDVREGVEFWKTLGRDKKDGHSTEFLNRSG
jgi:hypothetical protein